jgi:ribulose-phosphate 3-epimerase
MTKIAPSILSADFGRLAEEVARLEDEGADWVHVDVMDGVFVPNITIGPGVVRSIRPHTTLPLDVHLMIVEPGRYIEAFSQAGADLLTLHVEATGTVRDDIAQIRSHGKKAGLSLNPETPFEDVLPYLDDIDLLLIMTVRPGFGGQQFMAECVPKIAQAREYFRSTGSDADIEVDGGINRRTGKVCVKAGATVLAAGSSLFSSPDMGTEMNEWRRFASPADDR